MYVYLMGIDLGTSSLKVIIIDDTGLLKTIVSESYQYDTPSSGYAEQEPEIWWQACLSAVQRALLLSGIKGGDIASIGFSGQMHGLVMLDENGKSVRPAILHCDARSAAQTEWIKALVHKHDLQEEMMNPIYTGFLLVSLLWVKQNEPEHYHKIRKICMPKDYIKYRLSGVISTDYSDASATLAFNIKQYEWSERIIHSLGLDMCMFPPCYETCDTIETVCESAAKESGLSTSTIVISGGADAVMQGIGNGAVTDKIATSNIGSSGQVCFQSAAPIYNPELTTNTFCAYEKGRFITMGAIMHAGLALKWLSGLLRNADYKYLDEMAAKSLPGSGGLVFLPYLNGERSPHMNPNLSGMFLGCNISATQGDMARSVMEGVTFALRECMDVCRALGLSAQSVVASGGGSQSALWLQIQSDIFGLPLKVASINEQAALGAAIAAGVGAGAYKSIYEGCGIAVRYKSLHIEPDIKAHGIYSQYFDIYKEAYRANRVLLERVTLEGRNSAHAYEQALAYI